MGCSCKSSKQQAQKSVLEPDQVAPQVDTSNTLLASSGAASKNVPEPPQQTAPAVKEEPTLVTISEEPAAATSEAAIEVNKATTAAMTEQPTPATTAAITEVTTEATPVTTTEEPTPATTPATTASRPPIQENYCTKSFFQERDMLAEVSAPAPAAPKAASKNKTSKSSSKTLASKSWLPQAPWRRARDAPQEPAAVVQKREAALQEPAASPILEAAPGGGQSRPVDTVEAAAAGNTDALPAAQVASKAAEEVAASEVVPEAAVVSAAAPQAAVEVVASEVVPESAAAQVAPEAVPKVDAPTTAVADIALPTVAAAPDGAAPGAVRSWFLWSCMASSAEDGKEVHVA